MPILNHSLTSLHLGFSWVCHLHAAQVPSHSQVQIQDSSSTALNHPKTRLKGGKAIPLNAHSSRCIEGQTSPMDQTSVCTTVCKSHALHREAANERLWHLLPSTLVGTVLLACQSTLPEISARSLLSLASLVYFYLRLCYLESTATSCNTWFYKPEFPGTRQVTIPGTQAGPMRLLASLISNNHIR